MKIYAFVSWIVILFLCSPIFASELAPFRYLAHPLDATYHIANLVSSDAPRPMENARKDQWNASFTPTQFKVEQAFKTDAGDGGGALIRGDGVSGWALSAALGYGLSDRWQVYSLFTYVKMDGRMLGRVPGSATADQFTVEGENKLLVLNSGLGFDLTPEDSKWNIPIFFGIFLQSYKTDMTNSPLAIDNNPYTKIEGSGVLLGASVGLQATRVLFEKLKLMPYLFVGYTPKGPTVNIEVTNTNNNTGFSLGQKIEGELDTYPFPIAGLSVGWIPWNLEFSVSGPFISLYSEKIFEGLKMSKYSVSITF